MELNICYLIGGSIPYFLGGLRKKKCKSQEFMFQNAGHSSLLSSSSFSGGLTGRLTMLRNSEKMLESLSYMRN